MRYHDLQDICDTIAPRCDKIQNRPFGAVDSKLINKELINLPEIGVKLIYGPPHIEGVTEPFNFAAYPTWSHLGIPEIFNFTWIDV